MKTCDGNTLAGLLDSFADKVIEMGIHKLQGISKEVYRTRVALLKDRLKNMSVPYPAKDILWIDDYLGATKEIEPQRLVFGEYEIFFRGCRKKGDKSRIVPRQRCISKVEFLVPIEAFASIEYHESHNVSFCQRYCESVRYCGLSGHVQATCRKYQSVSNTIYCGLCDPATPRNFSFTEKARIKYYEKDRKKAMKNIYISLSLKKFLSYMGLARLAEVLNKQELGRAYDFFLSRYESQPDEEVEVGIIKDFLLFAEDNFSDEVKKAISDLDG
jgi:hypothetical protein